MDLNFDDDNSSSKTPRSPGQNSHGSAFSPFPESRFYPSNATFEINPSKISNNLKNKQVEILLKLQDILSKRASERKASDSSFIQKYMQSSTLFKDLSHRYTSECAKTIIRNSSVVSFAQGQLVTEQGKEFRDLFIFAYGEIAFLVNEEPQEQLSQDENIWQVFDQAINKAGSQQKAHRKKNRLLSFNEEDDAESQSLVTNNQALGFSSFVVSKTFDQSQIKARTKQESFLNLREILSNVKTFQETTMTVEPSFFLKIKLDKFQQILSKQFNNKFNAMIEVFRKVSFFDTLENSKLKYLVDKLKVREGKKHENIYREGEEVDSFFLLISGEVEISKNAEIFMENPNKLFSNRCDISQKKKRNFPILPYANFQRVFNFEKKSKKIVLAVLNSICLFGEEEIMKRPTRDVSAKIISQNARYYEIPLSNIEHICLKISQGSDQKITMENFFNKYFQSTTFKKILYRQNKLAEALDYENKKNINNLLFSKKPDIQKGRLSRTIEVNPQKHPQESTNSQSEMKPTFNNLNFNEIFGDNSPMEMPLNMEEMKVAHKIHSKFFKQEKPSKNSSTIRRKSAINISSRKPTPILNTTSNTSSFSRTQSSTRESMRSPHQKTVDIHNPLFSIAEHMKKMKYEKRLERESKKTRINSIYRNLDSSKDMF